MSAGAITVPAYVTHTVDDHCHLLSNSGARAVIVSKPGLSSRVLAAGGRLVNLGGAAGDTAEFSSAVLRSRSADVLGYTNNALSPSQRADALRSVLGVMGAKPELVQPERFPAAECSLAWDTARSSRGRVVLEF